MHEQSDRETNPVAPVTESYSTRQFVAPVIIFLMLLAGACAFSPNFKVVDSPTAAPFGGDFLQEWVGGYIIWQGDRARLYDQEYFRTVQHDRDVVGFQWDEKQLFPSPYPPFYYLAVSPISWFSPRVALGLWMIFLVGAMLLSFGLLARDDRMHGQRVSWILPASLLFSPVMYNFMMGQKGTILLGSICGTYVLMTREKRFWAGVVTGILVFKPHFLLVPGAIMLLKREWKFLSGMCATGIVAVVVSLLFFGGDLCLSWVRFVAGFGDYLKTPGYVTSHTHCWWGAFHLLLPDSPTMLVNALTVFFCVATLGIVGYLFRGSLNVTSPRFGWQFGALVIAMILCSPHFYTYDATLLAFPLLIAAASKDTERFAILNAILVFTLFGPATDLADAIHFPATTVLISLLLWTMFRKADPHIEPATEA